MFSPELSCAIRASNAARRVCQHISFTLSCSTATSTQWKSDRSPVTLADYASQMLICREIQTHFPMDSIMAEEDLSLVSEEMLADINESLKHLRIAQFNEIPKLYAKDSTEKPQRTWVIDPIDGTKGFLRPEENGQYAICIALVTLEQPSVLLGLLSCPRLNYCQYATKNGGSFEFKYDDVGDDDMDLSDIKPYPIRTSESSIEDTVIITSVGKRGHSLASFVSEICKKNALSKSVIEMDSQCKYALVARGDAHVFLRKPSTSDYKEKLWDHAAGWLIVQEAGGFCCEADCPTFSSLIRKENFTLNGHMGVRNGILGMSSKEKLILFK